MKKYSLFKSCILGTFIIALLVYITIHLLHSGARNPNKPNIVFILADDLGWGDLGAYGHPYARTPNIDKLAAEGTMFHRFYVTGPTCGPSRAGFMTSRSPDTYVKSTGKYGFQGRMTITELLNNNGYATGHFGKWVIGDNRDSGTYGIDQVSTGKQARKSIQGRDAPVFEAANAFIESNKDVPFYVNIWTHAVHVPLGPHPSHSAVFKDIEVKREDFSKFMQVKFEETENAGRSPHEGMSAYLGEIYALDIGVGNLLQQLDELGLRENTIVVFSSDNGPEHIRMKEGKFHRLSRMGYAGGFRGGKHRLYEGGVRMPFVIRWPGNVPAGNVNTTSITSALDWLPTLATIAGISYDKDMFEGEDVSDIWKGSKRSRKNPLFWSAGKEALLQGDWKMHRDQENNVSLYNLSDNPEEDVNVTDKHPEIVEKLNTKLDEWLGTLPNEDGSKAIVITPADVPEIK